MRALAVVLVLFLSACDLSLPEVDVPPAVEQVTPEDREAVLAVVQELFDAIAAKDSEAIRDLLLPGGRFVSLRPVPEEGLAGPDRGGGSLLRDWSREEFAEMLPNLDGELLERYWDPHVLVRGPLAVVWTPYDFLIDGHHSHCGIDAFTMVHTGGSWKIATVVYTVEPDECLPGRPRLP